MKSFYFFTYVVLLAQHVCFAFIYGEMDQLAIDRWQFYYLIAVRAQVYRSIYVLVVDIINLV